ncbi:MAG: ABC transporter permease subunit [Candidatus Omnitrophota bacterium]|nr:ABC transporter permease subunit [bacterium]MBU3929993.1 ABC transporter permease subunit [bacterium]MBU4122947.1 ABC transporter permease subunit [bacterium]
MRGIKKFWSEGGWRDKFLLFFFRLIFVLTIAFFAALIISTIIQMQTSSSVGTISKNEIFFAVKLTLITAFSSSALAVLISIPVAYILSRHKFPLKNAVETLLFIPVVTPPVALGAMLLMFFKTPLGEFFESHFFGVVYEVPGLVLAQGVVVFGIAVNVIKMVFNSVGPEYEEIARTLGATKIQAFFKVLLPLSKKGIIAAFFLAFARAIGEFGAGVMLAGATTMKTETLPIAIYLNFSSADVRGACVFTLISLIVSLGTLFLIKEYAENRKPLLQSR